MQRVGIADRRLFLVKGRRRQVRDGVVQGLENMMVFREYRGFEIRRMKVGMRLRRCGGSNINSNVGCRVGLRRDFVGYERRQ